MCYVPTLSCGGVGRPVTHRCHAPVLSHGGVRELKNDVRKENSVKGVLETSAARSDSLLPKQLANSHACRK